jgi:hypothetical protein
MSTVKRILSCGIAGISPHLEIMQGTVDQSIGYCSDPAKRPTPEHNVILPTMRGTPISTGQRRDLESTAKGIVDRTTTLTDIAMSNPGEFVRYHKGLQALDDLLSPPYRFRRCKGGACLLWLWANGHWQDAVRRGGPPPGIPLGSRSEQTKWFQGYSGQPVTILDEIRGQLPALVLSFACSIAIQW